MRVDFKGIIRGSFSEIQVFDCEHQPSMQYTGGSLEEVVGGLVLPEWIYTLKINGKRINNPGKYLKGKGVWHLCIRDEVTA